MRKLFSLFAALALCVGLWAAPATVPTVTDVTSAGYDVTSARVIVLYFDEQVCNDIVWAGSYNEWSTTPAELLHFEPLEGFEGWYVVEVEDASATCAGRPVQLKKDGSFSWDYQTGDVSAWMNMAQPCTQTATITEGFGGEANCEWPTTGAYIYEVAYFKLHNTPCGIENPKHDYTITAYLPAFCDEIAAYADSVRVMGGFDNWSNGVYMQKNVDEDFNDCWVAEIKDVEEGTEFKLRFGTDAEWKVQVRYNRENKGNETFGTTTNIVLQYDGEGYDFAACAPAPAVGDQFVDATSGLKFEVTSLDPKAVKVIANSYTGTSYNVPDTVVYLNEKFAVKEIGESAFHGCTALQSVTFESNACQNAIGNGAFSGVGNPDPALLTLPDNWTGTLPDEDGNWYGGKFELYEEPATPDCEKVQGVKAINPNEIGATISWNKGSATQWEIVVAEEELTPDEIAAGNIAIVKDSITSENPFVVDYCVETNKIYYTYVRALCGDDNKGEWSDVLTFKTTCVARTTEGYGFIDFAADGFGTSEFYCWTRGKREGTTADPSVMAGSHLFMSNTTASEGAYAIMPPIDVDSIKRLQVKFTASGGTGAAYLRKLTVGVITNPADLSTFEPIETVDLPKAVTTIQKTNHAKNLDEAQTYIVRFNNYAGDKDGNFGKQIMFLSENHGVANYIYIYSMEVDTISSCWEPVHLTEVEVNAYDATMGWEEVGTNYQVQLLADDKTTVLVDSMTNEQQMKFEGLTMLTKYYVQVRTICGVGDTSAWSPMGNFTTLCPPSYSVPYEQNFDDYASGAANYPECWERFSNSSTTYPYVYSSAKKDGKNGLYMYRTTSYYSYAVLPNFEGKPGELMLELDYRNSSTSYPMEMYIGIATDITSVEGIDTTIVMIDTLRAEKYSAPNNVWYHYIKPLDAYTGETGHIVFISPIAASSSTNGYAYLDNIYVSKTPTCFRPIEPTFVSATASSVTLTWTTVGKETAWDIACLPAGEEDMSKAIITTVSGNGPKGTVIGLMDATEYDVYVRANCGEGDVSEWSSMVSATTLCLIPSAEANWNFDDYTTRVLNPNAGNIASYPIEQCWLSKSASTTNSYQPYLNMNEYNNTTYSSKYAYTDSCALKFYSTSTAPAIAVLPEIVGDLDTMQVSFVGRAVYESYSGAGLFKKYYNSYATGTYKHSIKVGTVTNPYDMSTFEELVDYQFAEVTNANCSTKVEGDYWEPVTVSLYGAQGKYIAFLSEYNANNYAWIDNVKVEKETGLNMPTCLRVPEDKLSSYSADLTWKSRATKFEVVVKNANGEVIAKDTVATMAYTAKDLTPTETYTVEISAMTDDALSRSAAAKKSFTTPCAPYIKENAHWDFKDADYAYTGSTSYLIPTCWDAGQAVKSSATTYSYTPQAKVNNSTYQYSREAYDGSATVHDRALQFYNYSTTYADSYAILPELDVDMDNTALHFWMRAAYFYTATYSSSGSRNKLYAANNNYNKELTIGVIADETDITTFEAIDKVTYPYSWSANDTVFTYNDESGNDYWTEVVVPLKKYKDKGRIVLFYEGNGNTSYMYVDDLEIITSVPYIAPVYNTEGDVTSGIARWDTLTCAEYKVVENATEQVTWGVAGDTTWYVVKDTISLAKGAICVGDVRLILADSAQLTATGDFRKAGIQVSGDGNSLTIYAQSTGEQSGQLIATGGQASAGIGGGNGANGSNITINGGTITATGNSTAAGIGGGNEGSGSNITINGGTVTATGNSQAAGIGGGYEGSGSDITINGGTVIATGDGAAGIGGGQDGSGSNITINGGIVTATSKSQGAGIGGGMNGSGSNITINGGTVTATSASLSIAGIGSGNHGTAASNIFVATNCLVKADRKNPPTTVIENDGTDLAGKLAGKRYAILKALPYDTVSVTVKDTLCYQQLFISRLQSVTPMQDTTFNDTIVKTVYKDSTFRDSIYIYELKVLPDVVIKDAESDKVCYNTDYTWALPEGNRTIDGYTVAGVKTLYDTVRNSLNCDSIIYTLNLTVLPDVDIKDAESDKVCYDTEYTWVLPEGNRTIDGYTVAGVKTIYDTVRNSLNCDSIIYTLNLTVLPDVDIKDAESDKVCYNTDYTWALPEGNRTIDGYTVAGVKTLYDTVRNSLNCDSIIYTLNLTVLPDVDIKDAVSDKVCYNTEYTWVLPEGNRTIDGYTVAGVKTLYDTVRNSLDCDSIIYTLNLTVLPDVVIKDAESDKVCYDTEYTWVLPEGNRTIDGYTEAGVKTLYDTVRNSLNCDSIIYTLNLTVLPDVVIKDAESDKVCYDTDYTWALPEGNRTIDGYTVAGVKTLYDTVRNSLNCDSIIYTLNLTVWPATVDEPTKYDTILVDNLPYRWPTYTGMTLDCYTEGTHRDTAFNILGCDSIRYTLELAIIAHDTVTLPVESDLCHGESYTSREQMVTPYLVGDTTFSDTVPSIMMNPLLMRDSVYAYTIHVQSRYVDELPALVKLDSWLLVVDRKGIEDKGISFTADQVQWYRVEGEVDEYPFGENNDVQIGTGDYYTIASKMSGKYYALIDVDVTHIHPCAVLARTIILDCDAPKGSGPMLAPTIVPAGGVMTLSNLSEGESNISIYTTAGQLIRNEKVCGQTEHKLHAEGASGIYLLQVKSEGKQDVFKYIITH